MTNLRRFMDHGDAGDPYALARDHIAARLGTSLFREARLRSAAASDRSVLVSGHNSRKIGAIVTKGKWAGMPIFTLTLEERATCPRSCLHWLDCYGNKMHWPTRWMTDATLVPSIHRSLEELSRAHTGGFVVRLHVLGDFYAVEYVKAWERWLDEFPLLHVFGYTAWPPQTPIGEAVSKLAGSRWDRFAVRTSNGKSPVRSTVTTYERDLSGAALDGIVCPAQTGKTECCATCALCWQTEARIVFLAH